MTAADRLETLLSVYLAGRDRTGGPSAEELCRECPDLLSELRRRIAAVAHGDAALHSTGGSSGPDTAEFVAEFPARLGPYAVKAVIGRGGMGAVLLADDPGLGRAVAIKVMLPGRAADPVARDRFLREARAAAAVRHDHVVPIYHVGDEDGVPFLVMPLLEGESLAARLKRGPLAPGEAARVGREAALGLAAAHAKGLVHRDVKPANLWLEAPNGRVLVLDFGLARAADRTDALTAAGGVLGTPAYMAPEQADGREVDARADLFSLGATLYEAATGMCPFQRPTLTATLRAVAEDVPPAPAAVNPSIPAALSDLITRLLAKRPAERPSLAGAVAAELLAVAPGWSATATTAEYVIAGRRNRRPRAIVWAGIAFVVVLFVGVGGWLATRPGTPPPGTPPPAVASDAARGTDPTARPPAPAPTPVAPAAVPLKGSVDLLVLRKDRNKSDVVVRLNRELAMPLRTGDQFRIVAEVDRPAYLYLFWIDENGAGVPVYPWKLGEWGTRPAVEKVATKLDLKSPDGKAFEINGNAEGMETILMLARSTPLDATDDQIRGWFAGLNALPFRGAFDRVWFENFDVLEKDPDRMAYSGPSPFRGVAYSGNLKAPDGPVGLQVTLGQRIGTKSELSRAISFARIGTTK